MALKRAFKEINRHLKKYSCGKVVAGCAKGS